jgi:hypothetical protein
LSTPEGFVNPRADKEIKQYKEFAEAGKRGAAKRWSKPPYGEANSPPNATPIATNNHKPITNNHIKEKAQRGSRLTNDMEFPKEWAEFCVQERPDLNTLQTFLGFKDYWIAQPGQKGVKLDWSATWRNWVRNQKAQKLNFADIARVTVAPSNLPDPALQKIKADEKITRPPSLIELEKMAQLRRKA